MEQFPHPEQPKLSSFEAEAAISAVVSELNTMAVDASVFERLRSLREALLAGSKTPEVAFADAQEILEEQKALAENEDANPLLRA